MGTTGGDMGSGVHNGLGALRVHVPNNWEPKVLVVVIVVQVLGKYLIIG